MDIVQLGGWTDAVLEAVNVGNAETEGVFEGANSSLHIYAERQAGRIGHGRLG